MGAIAPATARDVFIREALVAGELGVDAPFAAHNRALIAEVAELEHKARREDVLVDEEAIAAFYAERVPGDVHSRATFERGASEDERRDPQRLFLTREALMRHAASSVTEALFPETLSIAGTALPLQVPLRAGSSARRPDADGAARAAEPDRRRDALVARARNDPRKGHALPEGAAEGVAQPADPVARDGDGAFWKRRRAVIASVVDALLAYVEKRLGDAPPRGRAADVALPAHSR